MQLLNDRVGLESYAIILARDAIQRAIQAREDHADALPSRLELSRGFPPAQAGWREGALSV